jgi:hypothetical protein
MGALYTANRVAAAPVADDTHLAITSGATEMAAVQEITVGGAGTASGVDEWVLRRSTTNGVTPTAQTPAKLSPTSPAAYIAAATTFTGTQPVTAADPAVWRDTLNVFGGKIRWVAGPGMGIWIMAAVAGDSELSLESDVGTGTVSAGLLWEEM